MIQFNIIGKGYLHLEKGGGLGFKAENQCFRFCDISLGRSSEFNAVDDEYNRTLLDLGGDPAMYGGMLRRRWPCQLQYDGGQVMGTLAVTGWSKGAFSCVFYMDDADWIRKIQETKMADLPVGSSYYLTWDAGYHPAPANQVGLPALSIVSYEDPGLFGGTGQLIPSMEVKEYLDLIAAYIGKPVTGITADEFRLVLGTANGAGEHSVTIDITASNAATVTGGVNDFTVEDVTLEWARSNILGVYVGGGSSTVKGFKALRNLEITFPNTVPNDCYLVRMDSRLARCEVLGGGSSNPLAGKTIQMDKNNTYVFVPNGWMSVDTDGTYYGWKDIYHPLTLTCTVSALEALSLGGVWSLQYNQPDMTIFEFLKSVALATGRDLIVNTDGIELSAGNSGKDNYVDLKRIVSIESVTRRVEAWGGVRKAVVGFDSEDYVVDQITSEWDIDNDQLDDEAEARSKFSEGTQGDYGIAIYDQTLENGVGKVVAKRCTIGRIDPNDTHLQRVLPPDYPSCGDIADNSTCVVVKTLAPEMEFFALKPYDYLIVRGQMYRWMSGEWSDGIMTLTLQKVSQAAQAIVPPPYDAKIEYLQSSGTQYIDTNIVVASSNEIIVDAQYLSKSGDNFLVGAPGFSGEGSIWMEIYSNTSYYVRFGSASSSNVTGDLNRHIFKIKKNGYYVDGVLKLSPSYTSMPSRSLVIFGRNSYITKGNMKIYSMSIKNGNDYIIDLIPVRKNGVGYMYDKVSGHLFGNDGTGDFILGPDVP